MPPAVGALAPVFTVLALGYLFRRRGFPGEGFWAPAERLTYFLLFPALLLHNLATADLGGLPVLPMAVAIGGAFSCVAALTLALRRRFPVDGPGFTSVFQGAVRMNTYVGIAAAGALGGETGLALTAVAIAVIVPLVNLFSVAVLQRYAGQGRARPTQIAGAVLRNPLVLACLAGLALNGGGVGLPAGGSAVLSILGRAALAVGLLAAGAGLQLRRVGDHRGVILATSALKLLVLPAVTAAACRLAGIHGLPAAIAVLFSALPGAPSSYILARQMGGDGALMASILTVQTALAALTMPLVLGALG